MVYGGRVAQLSVSCMYVAGPNFPLIQVLYYHNISSCGSGKKIENCFSGAAERWQQSGGSGAVAAELPHGAI